MTLETMNKLNDDWARFYKEVNAQEYNHDNSILEANIKLFGKITRD